MKKIILISFCSLFLFGTTQASNTVSVSSEVIECDRPYRTYGDLALIELGISSAKKELQRKCEEEVGEFGLLLKKSRIAFFEAPIDGKFCVKIEVSDRCFIR